MKRLATLAVGLAFLSLSACDSMRFWRRDKDKDKHTEVRSSRPAQLTAYNETFERIDANDREVLNDLHRINYVEITAGRMGMDKGTSEAVRRFGEHVWRDHTQNDQKVRDVAEQDGIVLAAPKPAVKEQQMLDKLARLSGSEFDEAFLIEMENAHQMAIRHFESAYAGLADSPTKDLIGRTLPTLRMHERQASNLQAEFGIRSQP